MSQFLKDRMAGPRYMVALSKPRTQLPKEYT